MNEIYPFLAGVFCVGFPLAIFYTRAREDRDYFERDRNGKDAELQKLRAVIAKCGPVTSEVRSRMDCEGGWIKAYMPTSRDVMNGHAMLAGRFDLIEPTRDARCEFSVDKGAYMCELQKGHAGPCGSLPNNQ